ncbi:hypothetical protein D3C72_2535610 [compost metagenome]
MPLSSTRSAAAMDSIEEKASVRASSVGVEPFIGKPLVFIDLEARLAADPNGQNACIAQNPFS